MRKAYTIQLGDFFNVTGESALTGIRVAIGSAIPDSDAYHLELVHDTYTRILVYVVFVLTVRTDPATLDTVFSSIARVPGVASVSGEGIYKDGPAKGRTQMPSGGAMGGVSAQFGVMQAQFDAIERQFRRADAQIQFLPDTPSGSSPVSIKVAVTNDVNVINQFTEVTGCRVTITGGTLSSSAKIRHGATLSPAGGPIDVTFDSGEATLLIEDAGSGTVELSIVDTKGSGLDVTDTATVTIS